MQRNGLGGMGVWVVFKGRCLVHLPQDQKWRLSTTADLREGFMSQEEAGRKRDFEGVYSINHNEMISPSLLVRYPTRSPISKSAAVLCILVGV